MSVDFFPSVDGACLNGTDGVMCLGREMERYGKSDREKGRVSESDACQDREESDSNGDVRSEKKHPRVNHHTIAQTSFPSHVFKLPNAERYKTIRIVQRENFVCSRQRRQMQQLCESWNMICDESPTQKKETEGPSLRGQIAQKVDHGSHSRRPVHASVSK
mmetsp:Transcript_2729/g.10487  ORF Transcript_2729/g.10487 Transcript_2729/m.10487 type:complete len:161 (-) Transcript_2729:115-597(-)